MEMTFNMHLFIFSMLHIYVVEVWSGTGELKL